MTPLPTDPPMPMDSLIPYRQAQYKARFLCLGCYRTASSVPGECLECGVALCDLSDPEVRLQIQEEAERRLHERKWREEVPIFSATMILTALALVLLDAMQAPLQKVLALLLFFPLQRMVTRAYTHFRRGTAIATFAARRKKLSGELGADVQVTALEGSDPSLALTAGEDPAAMETSRLLEWMGVRLPGAPVVASVDPSVSRR